MLDYTPGHSAAQVDTALKSALQAMDAAKQNAVLWFGEVLERRLFREFGYVSIHQYAEMELGFSSSRTGDFLSICRRLESLPVVREELSAGRLGYTKAREVVKVADAGNEREWVEAARTRSRRELERQVKQARKRAAAQVTGQASLLEPEEAPPAAAQPVRVAFEMTPAQFARWEALWERARKQGELPAERAEALLEMLGSYTAEASPRGEVPPPPAQVHVQRCPECGKSSVATNRGELTLDRAEAERIECDHRLVEPGKRSRSAIAPAVRRAVLERARYRCERDGCGHARFIEVHHVRPRARGGSNEPDNLIVLCSACHALVHRHGPGDRQFRPELE